MCTATKIKTHFPLSGQVLVKNMLKPLVMHPLLSVRVKEQEDEGTVLALVCVEQSQEKSAPSQVYSKLLLVLKTLHSHLLGTVLLDMH